MLLVAVFGEGMAAVPHPGVRGVVLDEHDPLLDEWCVLVSGPDGPGGLIVRGQALCGLAERSAEQNKRFDMAIASTGSG